MSIRSLEVYAELSKKQYNQIISQEASLEIPDGVSMKNHAGSRGLLFNCNGSESASLLIDGLENSNINWQINNVDYNDEPNDDYDNIILKMNPE